MRYNRTSEMLGFLGVGASKAEAVAAYEAAASELQNLLKKNMEEFPRAAAALNMWPKVMSEETQFWADRAETIGAWSGITFWGDRVEKANQYKARWTELAKQVASKARALGEKPKTAGYDGNPDQPEGDEFPWGITIGVLAAVGVVLFVAQKRMSGAVNGLTRRPKRK